MTILKNNHKSGINENNIKVATVTEEQTQSRAINPGALPNLPPLSPIVASVQVYQVRSGNADYQSTPVCNSQNHVFCKVTVTAGAKFKNITKALLKIQKINGADTGFCVYPASSDTAFLEVAPSNFVKTITQNGVTYAVIDISDYVKDGDSKEFYLAIISESGNMMTLSNTGTLEVSYVEDDDLIPSGKLEKQVGAKGGYSINARNGKLQYSQQIFASKGGLMPFGLSLSYNASNCDVSNPNGIANGMKGWTFNYQQSLRTQLNDILYVDASNVVHTFKHPTNNSSVWYDATGKNGMVLVATDTGYTMSDGQTTTLNFDTSKRLVSITQKLSSSKTVATAIEYASDGKISKVTDGLGDVYNFVCTSALVQVKKADALVAEITLASERVTQVKYSLSGDTVDFAYDTAGQLTSVLDSASHQKAVFEYNTVSGISAVKNYIRNVDDEGQVADVAIDSNHFEYKLLQTHIANCRNSDNKYRAYCTMAYLFAEDGELLTTADVKSSTLQPLRCRTKKDFERSSATIPDKLMAQAMFGEEEAVQVSAGISSDVFTVNTTDQVFNTYFFTAAARITSNNYVGNDDQKMLVQIVKGDQVLGSAQFDPSKREDESVCGTIILSPGIHTLQAQLVLSNLTAVVDFGYVKLYATKNGVQKQYVNMIASNITATEHDGTTETTWYEHGYCNLLQDDVVLAENIIFNSKDYALTLISRLQNPTAYNVWYNDGKNMLYQVSNVNLISGGPSYPIEDIKLCTMSTSMGKTIFEYIEPTSTYLYKARKVTTVTVDGTRQGVVSEEFVSANFQTDRVEDEHNVITTYSHDENGSVTRVRTFSSNGSYLDMAEHSEYDENNLQISRTEQRYLTNYTHHFVYGADYELTQEVQPNEQVTNFAYSDDKDKLASIFATVDEATSQNDITYNGDLVDTLSDTRTVVDFAYDERQNISQVKIANEVVLEKEITYNEYGATQSVTTYGNGQKIKKYYDSYDRLIKVSDVTEDETVLVQYIYSDTEINPDGFDPTVPVIVSANSPLRVVVDYTAGTTTWYTYDELGRIYKTHSSALTLYQLYDDYGRLSRYERSTDETDIYVVNLLSYVSPTDDSVASESANYVSEFTQGDHSTKLTTTYSRDGLQRPTETTVMQGDYGCKNTFTYIPVQEEEWVQDGFIPIIRPGSVGTNAITPGGHWEVKNIGTTQYVSTFKEYSMSGTTETLVRTDSVEYDANGNITKYGSVTYKYDKLGRLIRENNPTTDIDKTTTWCYDVSGNILSRTEYAYTTGDLDGVTPTNTFAYVYDTDWKDQLVEVTKNGATQYTFRYDQVGNPTIYKGATLTWERGRLLTGYNSIEMEYDASGIRREKVVPSDNGETTTTYIYDGDKLIKEVQSGNSTCNSTYLYNSQGIIGFVHDGITYAYRKNLFGDIIAIYNGATKVAEYRYDAWGNCKVLDGNSNEIEDPDHIAYVNPFRYRGYYWDNDLQLYYLMSRYYDPQTGRFINADSLEYLDPETIGGINLYAYCGDNPIANTDPNGTAFGLMALLAITLVSAVIGGVSQLVSNVAAGKEGDEIWRGVAGAALGSGINALLLCVTMSLGPASLFVSAGVGSIVQTGVDEIEKQIRGEAFSLESMAQSFVKNFTVMSIGNILGAKGAPTSSGWFKPQKFISVFTKSYGQKLIQQSIIGGIYSGLYNFVDNIDLEDLARKFAR